MKYKNIDTDPSSGDTDSDTQKTKLYTLMFNQNLDTVTIGNRLTPYITAGIGLARMDPGNINNVVVSGGSTNTSSTKMNSTTNLVWQMGLGASFKATETIMADVNIKRVNYGSMKKQDNTKVRLKANEFSGGLRINF